jgi:hypothetical protein
MEIPVIDKSNYLKGLLIVARKDKNLSEPEKQIIRKIAEKLGFASDFYEEVLRGLIFNKYISEEPVVFSNKEIAHSFISDALTLAFSDSIITEAEIDWLKKTASANLIDKYFETKLKRHNSPSKSLNNTADALLSII